MPSHKTLFVALVASIVLVVAAALPGHAEFELLTSERIGPLRYDMPQAAVQTALGKPARKSAEVFEAATGNYVENWEFAAKGLSIALAGEKKGGAKKVARIQVSAPCKYATSRGIRIGSTEAEVRKAYQKEIDREQSSAAHIVAGSIYGGVIFDLHRGRVNRIFVGAAAE